jgi:multidrug transporter EmrE-like cation transporter
MLMNSLLGLNAEPQTRHRPGRGLEATLDCARQRLCHHESPTNYERFASRGFADASTGPRSAPGHREPPMTAASFGLILTGVLLNAVAQLLLKAGTNALGVITPTVANALPLAGAIATNPHFLGGFACYGISVLVWILALSRVPVSIAYPMLSIGYVVNALPPGICSARHAEQRALARHRFYHRRRLSACEILTMASLPPDSLTPNPSPSCASLICRLPARLWMKTPLPAWSKCCAPAGSPPGRRCKNFEAALSDYLGGRPVRVLELSDRRAGSGPAIVRHRSRR